MTDFGIIVAVDASGGIGRGGSLPWRLPGDMAWFREVTTRGSTTQAPHAVVMGRVTWESIPPRFRPLPERLNVVVTRNPDLPLPAGVLRAASLADALTQLARRRTEGRLGEVFVIGGGSLYREALASPACTRAYVTRIDARFECDTFFPPLPDDFRLETRSAAREENGLRYLFEVYHRG